MSVSYEQGITENIGVGGIVGLGIDKESIGVYDMTYTNILIGVRGNYHFNISDSFDVYAGLILGYNAASASSDPDGWDVSVGGMIFGGQVGTRYCFSDKWAAFAELGYGLGLFSLGATYSF
ncbi:MAG: outer membrane beta-barrel protein [Rikenellaceae bacterium]